MTSSKNWSCPNTVYTGYPSGRLGGRQQVSGPGYAGTHGAENKSWVYLGRLAEAGPLTDVRFDTDLAHVVALFGKWGSDIE